MPGSSHKPECIEREVRVAIPFPVPIEVSRDERGKHVARASVLGLVVEVKATGRDFAIERCERAVARAISSFLLRAAG